MGKKEVKEKKVEKEPKKEAKKELDHYEHKHLVPSTSRKRSFRQLRKEFNAKCKAGDFQGAWEISKLYHRRWFEKHR